jgi:hypothetical protein
VSNITNINILRNVHGAVPPLARANRPQFSNLQGAFSNSRIRGAISTVASNNFGHGRVPVAHGVTSAMLHNSSFVAGRVPVAPTKASLSASSRGPAASSIPRAGSIPTHFAGTQSAAANKGSFVRNNANSARSFGGQTGFKGGRQGPVAEGASRSFGSTNGDGRMAPQAVHSNPTSQAGVRGWQQFGQGGPGRSAPSSSFAASRPQSSRFGAPSQTAPQARGNTAQAGWHRFAGGASTAAPSSSFAANRSELRGLSSPSRTAPALSGSGTRSGWQRFSSQPAPRNSFASPGGSRSYAFGEPPSQMNRPMFSPRSAPSYGGYSGRQYGYSAPRSAPSYGGGYGGFYSGGYNAPRSYGGYSSRSSGGYFGGGHSGGYGGGGGHFGGYGGGFHGGGGSHGGGGFHGGGGGRR